MATGKMFISTFPDEPTGNHGWWVSKPDIYLDSAATGAISGYYSWNGAAATLIEIEDDEYEIAWDSYTLTGTTSTSPYILYYGFTTSPASESGNPYASYKEFYFDSGAPSVSGFTVATMSNEVVAASGVVAGSIIVSISGASDEYSDISHNEFWVGDSLVLTDYDLDNEVTVNTLEFVNGEYLVLVRVFDGAGNYTDSSQVINIYNSKPTITPSNILGG